MMAIPDHLGEGNPAASAPFLTKVSYRPSHWVVRGAPPTNVSRSVVPVLEKLVLADDAGASSRPINIPVDLIKSDARFSCRKAS